MSVLSCRRLAPAAISLTARAAKHPHPLTINCSSYYGLRELEHTRPLAETVLQQL
jgi:hypothetical protein